MTLIIKAQAPPLKIDHNGVMRVGGTRITLDTVVHAFDEGSTAEEIVSRYPALKLADVYAVIAYYLNNREAVGQYLQQQEESEDDIWHKIESLTDYQIFRERLLATKDKPPQR
jgi:uncharacterized protein (DUF433 family)